MPIPNINPSQLYPIAGAINPQSVAAAGTANTGYIKVPVGSKWVIVNLLCGALGGGSEQVDIQQATSSGGAGSKALVTNAITNAVNSTQTQYEFNLDGIDVAGGFNYIRAVLTNTGGTGALVAASLQFGPSSFEG